MWCVYEILQSSAWASRICCLVLREALLIKLRLRGLLFTSSATATTLEPCAARTCFGLLGLPDRLGLPGLVLKQDEVCFLTFWFYWMMDWCFTGWGGWEIDLCYRFFFFQVRESIIRNRGLCKLYCIYEMEEKFACKVTVYSSTILATHITKKKYIKRERH